MSTVRRRAALALALLLAVILLPRGAGPVQAGDPDVNGAIAQQQQMQTELTRQQQQLTSLLADQQSLGASLQKLRGDLDAVGVAISDAEGQLKVLSDSLERSRAELAADRAQLANLSHDLALVATQIQQNRDALGARESLLQDHLRQAYAQSQVSILEVILSSQTFADAARELGDMLALSDADRALADQIRVARQQLEVRQATLRDGRAIFSDLAREAEARASQLATQQAQLTAARADLAEKLAKLRTLKSEQQAQLAVAARDAETYRAKIAAQEAALAGQAELVARLKEQARKLDLAYHGRFQWPLIGDFVVTQEFGPTIYETFHAGIDIAYYRPICGGKIYAAADGVVLADGRPKAEWGDTAIGVIIGHSQRLQTWYWHLASEVVSVGEEVHAGDLIGYEGATGWASGCHLHFQVMFDDKPVNPRLYLP
jgi:murein DD-endopeptidase MepM/ murein hydrolase activator NlpD